ncbi:MAG: hypothetical protein ACOC4R_01175, partial [Bacteroidota bacterium]
MKRYLFILVSICFSFTAIAQHVYDNYFDGQVYIVVQKEHNDTAAFSLDFVENLFSEINITSSTQPFTFSSDTLSRTWLLKFSPANKVDELIRELNQRPEVEFAERVPLTRVFLTPDDPLYSSTVHGYNWNWHLDIINAEGAWDISTGSADVKLAIVDNAIYTEHPELKNKSILEK